MMVSTRIAWYDISKLSAPSDITYFELKKKQKLSCEVQGRVLNIILPLDPGGIHTMLRNMKSKATQQILPLLQILYIYMVFTVPIQ